MNRKPGAISAVDAWLALDSRGRPTIACRIGLSGGAEGIARVPSGASAGSHEALELRDGGIRFGGRGVARALEHVRARIGPAVLGLDPSERGSVDAVLAGLDPSPGFQNIGANAVLAVSIASELAAAASTGVSLARRLMPHGALAIPMPMVNIISGGAHAGGLLDVQDFLVIPAGAESFALAIEWCAAVRERAGEIAVRKHPMAVLVADEGGISMPLASNREALEVLMAAIEAAGLAPGDQVTIALDVAATELFADGRYQLRSEGRTLDSADLVAEVVQWCEDFPVVSVEDILAEDDWEGWQKATLVLGDQVDLVGDDLFVTNPARLERGVASSIANSVLVKVNQNGVISGARDVLDAAQRAGYGTVVSARSGETEDSWLADLAVGWNAGQIKVGSTHRSERTAKWNRLLELEALEQTSFCGPWAARAEDGVRVRSRP